MNSQGKGAPSNWNSYERGRASSTGSLTSITESEPQHDYNGSPSTPTFAHRVPRPGPQDGEHALRERRSSMFFNSIRHMGGVNNIDNFARSFQRAAGFRQITPVRRGSVSLGDQEPDTEEATERPPANKSLLRQQLQDAGPQHHHHHSGTDIDQTDVSETAPLLPTPSRHTLRTQSIRSHLAVDGFPALASSYGSISSGLTASAQRRASILIQQRLEASMRAREEHDEAKDDYMEPQVEIETRDDGVVIEHIVGESTVPMTIFNSTNVLIGVGILALPLGIKHSGWVIGILFLTFAALITNYTAKLLAKCLDTNTGSTTYGDIAFLAFDSVGRGIVESIFVVELLAANVALVILFGDSMNLLTPAISTTYWKILLCFGLLPLNFVPFKTLSVTSILGVICCLGIIVLVFADGLVKPHSPGSLREVAKTYAFPANWRTVPLSFGLFMAPWGGHSVFPAIYKDMRHPQKYPRALKTTYVFTYGLDLTMAILGYLMFGETVRDEITANILRSKSYPRVLSIIIVILIAIIPVTKIPLSNRPLMDTVNKKFMIDLRQMDAKARQYSQKSWKHRLGRGAIAVSANILALAIAIILPDFDSIMALLGSAFCFSICVILPVAFYLQIFSSDGNSISKQERIIDWILIVVCVILAVVGTVFAILPKSKIGAEAICGGLFCTK